MMKLRFTKMHGLGNDFVMVDAISQRVKMSAEKAKKIADRHFGIGCDQVLVVEAPSVAECDFDYRIFNHDGAEVENCGNGARCFAVFVRQRKLTGRRVIRANTKAGVLQLTVLDDNRVIVDMGEPILEPASIPFSATTRQQTYSLSLQQTTLEISAVSMGNPHAVTEVDDVEQYNVLGIGSEVECHPLFPNRVNAGFMQVLSQNEVKLRVYERGVGETLACGTGACAAVVAGIQRGRLSERVLVHLPGGDLTIEWQGKGSSVLMTGPAKTVFHGQLTL